MSVRSNWPEDSVLILKYVESSIGHFTPLGM